MKDWREIVSEQLNQLRELSKNEVDFERVTALTKAMATLLDAVLERPVKR